VDIQRCFLYDIDKKKIIPLIEGIKSHFKILFLTDKVIIETNYRANDYKIVASSYEDIFDPIDKWQDLIPEREYSIETVRVTKSKILVEYLRNICSMLVMFDHDGSEISEVPLPEYSSLAGIGSRKDSEEFFSGVESCVFPKISYKHDPLKSTFEEFRKTENPIETEGYEVRQEWSISKDQTKIPFFIFYKKGIKMDSKNPTILYGYGEFAISQTPCFMRVWVPWIRRGGIFVVANIRGGSEFGEKWHLDGMTQKKQNSYDDFISVAEYLIKNKYTDSAHLGTLGGSNGGLLVSATAVQRPDLFNAACSQVPLTDMVRFHKFGMAIRWTTEYGNPENPKDLEAILKWSPYHNVKQGVEYPNFLFTTAEGDSFVNFLVSDFESIAYYK